MLLHCNCLLAKKSGLSTSRSGSKSAGSDPMNQFLGRNLFLHFTFAMCVLRAKRIHRHFELTQPQGCSSTCPNFSSEFHIHFQSFLVKMVVSPAHFLFGKGGFSPSPGLGAAGPCTLLCQSSVPVWKQT